MVDGKLKTYRLHKRSLSSGSNWGKLFIYASLLRYDIFMSHSVGFSDMNNVFGISSSDYLFNNLTIHRSLLMKLEGAVLVFCGR